MFLVLLMDYLATPHKGDSDIPSRKKQTSIENEVESWKLFIERRKDAACCKQSKDICASWGQGVDFANFCPGIMLLSVRSSDLSRHQSLPYLPLPTRPQDFLLKSVVGHATASSLRHQYCSRMSCMYSHNGMTQRKWWPIRGLDENAENVWCVGQSFGPAVIARMEWWPGVLGNTQPTRYSRLCDDLNLSNCGLVWRGI